VGLAYDEIYSYSVRQTKEEMLLPCLRLNPAPRKQKQNRHRFCHCIQSGDIAYRDK
jgi:hypothetical protein